MAQERTPLARPAEVAAYLDKPEKTLAQWRWLKKGPRFVKIGGRDVRYRWSDIEKWLDEQGPP